MGFIKRLFVDPDTGEWKKGALLLTAVGVIAGFMTGGPGGAILLGALGLGAAAITGHFSSSSSTAEDSPSAGLGAVSTVNYGEGEQLEPGQLQPPHTPGMGEGQARER